VTILAFFSAIVIVVGLLWVLDARNGHAAALRAEVERARLVAEDAAGVVPAATQPKAKRKVRR
jgi:hypothetical protein